MREKILFDDVLKKIPNKYILTIVTGKRVRELAGGAEPLSKIKGNIVTALRRMKCNRFIRLFLRKR